MGFSGDEKVILKKKVLQVFKKLNWGEEPPIWADVVTGVLVVACLFLFVAFESVVFATPVPETGQCPVEQQVDQNGGVR